MNVTEGRDALRLTARLGIRFTRSRSLARSTSIVFIVAIFVMAMYVTLSALSLSGEQVAQRDLGRYGAQVGYGSVTLLPGDESFLSEVTDRVRGAGVPDVEVMLSATDVQLATKPVREVTLLQAAWAARPYPERYALLSGRWPSRPGEVVVTEPGDVRAVAGEDLLALGGNARFQVVGTANDRYASTSNILAAPGTWAKLSPQLARSFSGLKAQPYVLWSGRSADRVIGALTAEVTERRKTGGDPAAVPETLITRQEVTSRPERTWIDRSPAGYTVPSLLLPLGAVFLVFGLNDRRFRRTLNVLVSVGVRPAIAVASLSFSAVAWCLMAATAGGVAGFGVGALVRVLLSQVRDQPAGPITGLAGPGLRLAGIVVIGGVCATLALARARGTTQPPPEATRAKATSSHQSRSRKLGRDLRHVLAAIAWGSAIVFAARVDTPAKAMILSGILTTAVLLGLPDIINLLIKVLPERGPRRRLARRRLAADTRRLNATVAVLTVVIGASLGYLTLLDTMVRTLNQQSHPDTLPGQLLVTDRSSTVLPPPDAVDARVQRSAPHGTARVPLRYLMTSNIDDPTRVTRQGSDGTILAVDSSDQIQRLIDRPLTPAQQATLQAGGLLVWSDIIGTLHDSTARIPLVVKHGDTVNGRTPPLPVTTVDAAPAGWRDGTDGVLLTSKAHHLNLPVTGGAIMYTGLTGPQAQAVQRAVIDAGMDAKTIQIYTEPPPVIPHTALIATAVGLVILVLFAGLATTRAQALALRGYLAQLISIGIPTTWARQILLCQHALIITLSTLLGSVIAVIPVLVIVTKISGFVLSIPWTQLLTLTTATYLSFLIASLLSIRSLRAKEVTTAGAGA